MSGNYADLAEVGGLVTHTFTPGIYVETMMADHWCLYSWYQWYLHLSDPVRALPNASVLRISMPVCAAGLHSSATKQGHDLW
jgi:hypothetical protein